MVEPTALVGQVVDGRWLLLDHLGSGRFGDVYSAEPRHLDLGAGAVKVLRPESDRERRQILREIQALAELNHDGLLGYRDAGEIHEGVLAGGIYVVTELCEGTLADTPGWGTGSVELQVELAEAVRQVAAALHYLHDRGFVHRDVKPANILRSGDTWKLSDFGLVHERTDGDTGRGVAGTAPYLAPETSSSKAVGPPADIYALGVVVHEGLTGTWPYDRGDGSWSGPPLAEGARTLISAVLPDPWRPIVELCLDVDPKRRPRADEIAALVPDPRSAASVVGPTPVPSRTQAIDTLPPSLARWWSRSRALMVVAAILLATVAAVSAVTLSRNGDSRRAEPGSDLEPPSRTNELEDGVLMVYQDLTLEADQSTPISVRAHGVVIDCAGHTISGPGDEATLNEGRGISVTALADVEIRSCRVTGFETGVFVGAGSTGVLVSNSLADGNRFGFSIDRSTVTLRDNRATDNELVGILAAMMTESSLTDNVSENNGRHGFDLEGSSGNVLDSNRASGNHDDNFLVNDSPDNLLVNNFAEGPGAGFMIADSDDNTIRGNSAIGDGGPWDGFAISVSPAEGDSTGNVFEENLATGFAHGFRADADPAHEIGSAGTTYRNNAAENNIEGFADHNRVGTGTSGTGNEYVGNTCSRNDVASTPDGLCSVE